MKENQIEKAYRLIFDMIFKYQLPPKVLVSNFTLSKTLGMSRIPNHYENIIEALDYNLEFHRVFSVLYHNQQLNYVNSFLEMLTKKRYIFSLALPNFDTPRIYSEICNAIEAGYSKNTCAKFEESFELEREQNKNAIEKFNIYGLQGIYNFIANNFKFFI